MSLFPNSSNIIIYGGNFTSIGLPGPTQDAAATTQLLGDHDDYAQVDDLRKRRRCMSIGNFKSIGPPGPTQDAAATTQVLGKRKDRGDDAQADDLRKRRRCSIDILDGLTIVKADEVDLHTELITGIGYRIHSASHNGRLVAVKAFEGPRAKQDWKVDVAFSKEFLHSNVLKIAGVSNEGSKSHFILFRGITSEQKMQSLIATALRTDLNMSVQISMKAVKGIAAGLSYIKSQNIPVYPGTMNNKKWGNFNIFTGHDNEPVVSFDPSSIAHENGNFDVEIDGSGVEVLSEICQQLFSEANSILYDDSPEREVVVYDREGFPRASLEDEGGPSNVSEKEDVSNPSNSTEKAKSCRTPRREVKWLDLGSRNRSLESIKRRFQDRLDRFLSSSNSLLRRITSPMNSKLRHNLHQCPGYLREEITLASDVSKSVIVSHAFPSQSEICSICGQLVQYNRTELSIVDGENLEVPRYPSQNNLQNIASLLPLASSMKDASNISEIQPETHPETHGSPHFSPNNRSMLSPFDHSFLSSNASGADENNNTHLDDLKGARAGSSTHSSPAAFNLPSPSMPSIVDESPSQDPNPQLIFPSTYGLTLQPSPGQQLASPHRYGYEFGIPSSALSKSNKQQWNVQQQTPDQTLFGSPLAQYASPFDGYGGYNLTSDFSGGLTGVSSSPLLSSSFAVSGLPFRGLDYIRSYNPGGFATGDQNSLWQGYDPGAFGYDPELPFSLSASPSLLSSSFAASGSGLPFRGLDYVKNYNPGGFARDDQDSLWQSYDPGAFGL